MEEIKRFDAEFKKLNSYYALGCNFVKYVSTFCTVGLMFIFPLTDDRWLVNISVIMMLCYITLFQVNPYIFLKQGRVIIPIYKLMRDAPINRKDFIYSRVQHLFKYVIKLAVGCIAVRLFSLFVLETPTLEHVLISLLGMALAFGISIGAAILEIYHSSRY